MFVNVAPCVEGGSMPGSWDPQVYWEQERQSRDAAAELSAGETRDAYLTLSEGHAKLADLIAMEVTGETKAPLTRPAS